MRDEPLPTAIAARAAVDLLWLVVGGLVLGVAAVVCQSWAVWAQ